MNISIIGYGHMAQALVRGLLPQPDYHFLVSAPSLTLDHSHPRCHTYASNLEIMAAADLLILAVKPQKMAAVLAEIGPHLRSNLVVISIAAGLNMAWFQAHLPANTPIIRAMPNLAAAYQQSATPLYANAWSSPAQRQQAWTLFQHCGCVTWAAQESDLDAFTALSGSGLAYVFAFIDAMRQAGITLGLDPSIATTFAEQTLQGAAHLAAMSQHSLPTLQDSITSKGGTTAAALDVFAKQQLSDIVLAAMQAAVARSQDLRKKLCQD